MHMMSVVDLIGNAVHPSVIPDIHDGICSTPTGKYSTPSEAPHAHDGCCRLGRGMQCTKVCLLVYMMAYAVHHVRLLMHMMSGVDLIENTVHISVLPDIHDGICSTPSG